MWFSSAFIFTVVHLGELAVHHIWVFEHSYDQKMPRAGADDFLQTTTTIVWVAIVKFMNDSSFSSSSVSFNLYLRYAFHLSRLRRRFALPPAIDESYWRWCGGTARCQRCHAATPDWQLKDCSAAIALLCTAIDFVQWYHCWNFIA